MKVFITVLTIILAACSTASAEQRKISSDRWIIRSERPAEKWEDAFVTGNTIYSEQEVNDGLAIQTSDCSGVKVAGNRYLPLSEWANKMEYLDNGVVRIGVDLSIGGSITYFADHRSDGDGVNMVNSHDWGRQVQMSFYSGPNPYEPNGKKPREAWKQLGWNPIQSGDCYGNRSKILKYKNDGKELYVKCIPMHWPHNNVEGNCTFETWIRLEGPASVVRSRITNKRNDKTQYPARSQELPAVYTNGPWYRLITYTGNKPFTKDSVSSVPIKDKSKGGFPWSHFQATENWAALVNTNGKGMGVWTPGVQNFLGGFADEPGKGGPKDNSTGYIAPIHDDILDHNIQYEYEYRLIAGSIEEIRDYVYKHSTGQIDDFDFSADRQHWVHRNASDDGWPMKGKWSIRLEKNNPRIIGPEGCWNADKYPVMEITATFRTNEPTANIEFLPFGSGKKSISKHVSFEVINDGKMRIYRINLSDSPDYRGAIRKFSLLPCKKGKAGQFVKIKKIRLLR